MRPHVYRNPRGAVAQLGERLNGIQEADGSIPFSSTISFPLVESDNSIVAVAAKERQHAH